MWLIVNITLFVLFILFADYGKHIDSSEDFEAMMWFGLALICLVSAIASSLAMWIWG